MTERAVILGGTSGIGLATAHRMVDSGREVIITGRSAGKLETALGKLGGSARGSLVDARDYTALQEFFASTGPVDHVVVTVTGAPGTRAFADLTMDGLREGVDGKLVPHTAAARAALPVLRGSLTFVSAASAGAAMPGTAALAAVNAGIEAMVPVLAVELAPVRVNAVSPGVIDTAWWDFLDADAKAQTFAGIAAGLPAGRVGTADDIASAIAFLADNTFTTGIVLRVDGGGRLGSAA
ncbi:SDR family oxidoreductase [Amycolatopsis endophytica]|uniref:NAD(P)-dependent dehydrogenase (Short-subunit alcohol dehydrogenase family) n=1 Tax=Amycolatopsis endophytica TaxID=860233 RepID=A0A853AXL8_9PSEU|nr:SDR family oxidoreductase [Amycolatopsis endophytica]NYI87412.1 NAD(P)-dependent dehydrogenase (short-subunit alcohol dehydrogenase family) [Amycolatopsis endophytica]